MDFQVTFIHTPAASVANLLLSDMAERFDNLSGFNLSHNLNQLKPAATNPLLSKLFGKSVEELEAQQAAASEYLLKQVAAPTQKCTEPYCDCSSAFHCTDYVEQEPARIEPWIGIDLDGTLAQYEGYQGPTHIGAPIPKMIERVKAMLAQGKQVKVFTARVYADNSAQRKREKNAATVAIWKWCEEHIGVRLEVTCIKDFGMIELWDDRAVQVNINTGLRADGKE